MIDLALPAPKEEMSVMLSSQLDQSDRKEALENDKRVRGSTFLDHVTNDIGGRFTHIGAAHVVGSTAVPNYPAAAAHQFDPSGPEPALGYSVDAMPGDPTDVPASTTPLVEDRVGSPPSSRKPFRRFF